MSRVMRFRGNSHGTVQITHPPFACKFFKDNNLNGTKFLKLCHTP